MQSLKARLLQLENEINILDEREVDPNDSRYQRLEFEANAIAERIDFEGQQQIRESMQRREEEFKKRICERFGNYKDWET